MLRFRRMLWLFTTTRKTVEIERLPNGERVKHPARSRPALPFGKKSEVYR
jgi:hypothetical protein